MKRQAFELELVDRAVAEPREIVVAGVGNSRMAVEPGPDVVGAPGLKGTHERRVVGRHAGEPPHQPRRLGADHSAVAGDEVVLQRRQRHRRTSALHWRRSSP